MIDELNATVWCKLATSPIHGVGVFAIRDIPKGQKVYATNGERTWLTVTDWTGLLPEIREVIRQRWPFAFQGQPFQSPNDDARLTSFMNGSDNPNYDFRTDTVLRDIKAGEELTEDYSTIPNTGVV